MLTHDRTDTVTSKGQPLVDASFAAHPSNVSVSGDIEKVRKPLSIAIGDEDSVMPLKQVREAQQILQNTEAIDCELVIYPGARHDFRSELVGRSLKARKLAKPRKPSNKLSNGSESSLLRNK